MRRGLTITFLLGLLIGGMAALLFWYYQKSTTAEDGALALLDKLAMAERRLRQMSGEQKTEAPTTPPGIRLDRQQTDEVPSFLRKQSAPESAEDLTTVKGIGPIFASRLDEAEIETVAQLTAVPAEELAVILQISESRASNILQEANKLH